MPAGIPSGDDPTQYTIPDGFGLGGQGLSNGITILPTLVQEFVTAFFGGQVQDSPGWTNASSAFFDVILGGFQSLTDLVAQIASALTGGAVDLSGLSSFFADRWDDISSLFSIFQNLIDGLVGGFGGSGTGNTLSTLISALDNVPLFGDLLQAITGSSSTGGGGLTGLTSVFGDFLGILGSPTGIGSGSPTLPGLSSIPLFGPLFSIFGGSSSSAQAGNFFTSLLSLIGNPTGMTSGSPVVPALGSIPILGPIFSLFGGASNATQAGNFFTSILSLFGNPTGILTGSPTVPALGSIPILGPIFGLFGGATNATQAGNFFTSILGLFGNPTGVLTGSPTLPALSSIPIFGPLFSIFGGASNSTQAGNFLSSVTSLFGNPTGMTSGSPTVPALSSIPILGPVFGLFGGATTSTQANNFFTNLLSIVNSPAGLATTTPGSFDPVAAGVQVLDSVVPAVSGSNGLFNTIFNGIFKQADTGRGRDDVSTAVNAQTDTLIGQASDIAAIRASLGAGTPDSDAFERVSSTDLGPNWSITRSGSGVLATPNGHDAHDSGSGNIEYVARKTDKQASTDHQTVTNVLATAIPSFTLTVLPYGGSTDVWCRMTAFTTFATRTGLRFRINSAGGIGSTNWYIHWVSAGTETQLATGTMSAPAAGARIEFEAGVAGNMRAYQGRLNGVPVANFTDSVDRGLGTANRFRGFGGKGNSALLQPNVGTPDLNQWTATG